MHGHLQVGLGDADLDAQHEEVLVEHEDVAMLSQPEHRRRRSPCRSRRAGADVDVVSARAYEELVVVLIAHNMRRCW